MACSDYGFLARLLEAASPTNNVHCIPLDGGHSNIFVCGCVSTGVAQA